jgi:hypothetical protein
MKKLIVLFVALVMVFAALPAFAKSSQEADWAFYGEARMWTAWEAASSDTYNIAHLLGQFAGLSTGAPGGTISIGWKDGAGNLHSDGDLDWKMGSTAKIGATVKYGDVSGAFQFRTFNYPTGGDYIVDLALLYGKWDFGSATLEVGKDYPPYFYLISNVCGPGAGECSGVNYGSIYTGRRPQVRLNMGGFAFALVEPQGKLTTSTGGSSTNLAFDVATGTQATYANVDTYLPGIQAAYTFTAGPVGLFVGGLFQTIKEYYNVPTGEISKNVNSFVGGIGAKSAFGPLYINATVQYASNPAASTLNVTSGLLPRYQFVDSTNDYNSENAEYFSGFGVIGFKLTDALSFEGGVSYQKGKVNIPSAAGGDVKQNFWMYYLMAMWSPAKNVYLAPEAGYIDATNLKVTDRPDLDLGNAWWLGMKWQINF